MRRLIQIILVTGITILWLVYAFLVIRQRYLLDSGDPMRDTGISFGYTFLLQFALPALLGVSVIVLGVLAWMKRASTILDKQDSDREEFLTLAATSLADSYAESEVEYSEADLK